MHWNRILCIILCLLCIPVNAIFAEATCDIKLELPESTELVSQIKKCLTERSGWNPNSITEFVCPQGEVYLDNNQKIDNQTLAYLTAVNLSFNTADENIKKYIKTLTLSREPNSTKWIETMNVCREKIQYTYASICAFWTLESKLKDGDKNLIHTTDAYPQSLCITRAKQKLQWWDYLQKILMADGIAKNHKNSTDAWATEVKWAYARILGNWHSYQKILARAISKMTGYTKESI